MEEVINELNGYIRFINCIDKFDFVWHHYNNYCKIYMNDVDARELELNRRIKVNRVLMRLILNRHYI